MTVSAFFDTNVPVHAVLGAGKDEPERKRALELIESTCAEFLVYAVGTSAATSFSSADKRARIGLSSSSLSFSAQPSTIRLAS